MMTRSVLFAVMLACVTLVAAGAAAPALAQEKKGILGFFNRQTDTGGSQGGPIHMTPGIEGASKSDGPKAYGFDKNTNAPARYEDSPINAENERAKASMAKWLAADKAQALAEGAALNEQIRAENAYNEQVAKKQQAEKLAQSAKAMSAGTAPGGAAAKALSEQARAQDTGMTKAPNGMLVPPGSSRLPQNASPTSTTNKRPQGLFNRIDDEE